jgi:hypothetical protein
VMELVRYCVVGCTRDFTVIDWNTVYVELLKDCCCGCYNATV